MGGREGSGDRRSRAADARAAKPHRAQADCAKITAPEIAGVVERQRLYDLLDKAGERRVTWVSGPAGSGKTTLVARYLERSGATPLWYRVDAGDADPVSLFHYLRLAAEDAGRAGGEEPLPVPGPEHLPALALFGRHFFRALFAALAPPFVLVFDNVQDVAETAPFLGLLVEGLAEMPAGGRVILISRSEPAPALSRLRATRRLAVLGWSELRFEADEALALVRLLTRSDPHQDPTALVEAMHGWAAGLVLLADGARPGAAAPAFDAADIETVFDYFAAEVLSSAAAERDLLLKTAFLVTLTQEEAAALTGDPRAGVVLAGLSHRNFFTVRRPPGMVFEYHPLFRRFLKSEAERAYPRDVLAEVRSAAIEQMIEVGDLNGAVALIRDQGDWPRLVRFLDAHAPGLLAETRHATVAGWLAPLPEAVLEREPWLRYWLGAAEPVVDPARAKESLARAYRRFRELEDAAGAYLAWATLVEMLADFYQYDPVLDPWLDEFAALATAHPEYPSEEIECRVAIAMLTALCYRQPWKPDVDAWHARGLALARRRDDAALQAEIALQRLHALILAPHDPRHGMLLGKIAAFCDERGVTDFQRVEAHIAFAAKHCHAGRHEECLAAARNGLALADRSGIMAYNPLFLLYIAWSSLNVRDAARARRVIDELAPLVEGAPSRAARAYLHFARAYERYAAGDVQAAAPEALASLACIGDAGTTIAHVILRFLVAHVLTETGRPDEALGQLQPLKEFAERTANPLVAHHCLLAEAEIALARGDEETALERLREGMTLGRDVPLSHALVWRPEVLARLCGLALAHEIEVETVSAVIRSRRLRPGPEWRHLESWPRPLKVLALGDFAIERDGERLAFGGRAPQKPLELLKALIALGGRGVGIERLKDALWPEAEGDAAKQAFDTTLFRLRRLLGVDGALVLAEGRLTLAPELSWVDALAVQDLLAQGRQALAAPTSSPAALEATAARLRRLYRGGFLEGLAEEGWAEAARARLAIACARFFDDLGRLWERQRRPDCAAACYRESLAIAGLASETLRQKLKASLRRLGAAANRSATG